MLSFVSQKVVRTRDEGMYYTVFLYGLNGDVVGHLYMFHNDDCFNH